METIQPNATSGIRSNALHAWGMFFTAVGILGQSVLQNRLLGLGQVSTSTLLDAMRSSDGTMLLATTALVMQALETCAVPIYAFLLVEGFQHTGSYRNYLLRVLGLAVASEVPYNFAMSGHALDLSSQNPVFGLALGLIVLYWYDKYRDKTPKNVLIKGVITLAALIWPLMLKIRCGSGLILILTVLWAFRKKPLIRNLTGAVASVVCTIFSPFFLAAPMGLLAVHFYNGEKGENDRLVNYLTYPALLVLIGLIGILAF